MQGISKNLVTRAFPDYERPDYLTSAEFFKFTPTDEFMSLPGDIARTEFRLVRLHLCCRLREDRDRNAKQNSVVHKEIIFL